jgi:hypothetical protein
MRPRELQINNMKNTEYFNWIISRLTNKHKENYDIIDKFKSILNESVLAPKILRQDIIDMCCKKHFFDFDMEKSDDFKVGYTDKERNNIRKLVSDIYETVISHELNTST